MTQNISAAEQALRDAAREYHRNPSRGKISVNPTKPLSNQRDLSLAYSPGVAYPCLDIQADPTKAFDFTSRGNLVAVITNGTAVLGELVPAVGTPLYTDVRLYVERGIPGVIYGAGPRTVLESHAKRSDERLDLEDLRRATKVIARALSDLLAG